MNSGQLPALLKHMRNQVLRLISLPSTMNHNGDNSNGDNCCCWSHQLGLRSPVKGHGHGIYYRAASTIRKQKLDLEVRKSASDTSKPFRPPLAFMGLLSSRLDKRLSTNQRNLGMFATTISRRNQAFGEDFLLNQNHELDFCGIH